MNVYVFYWIVTYSYNKHSLALQVQFYSLHFVKSLLFNLKCSWKTFFFFLKSVSGPCSGWNELWFSSSCFGVEGDGRGKNSFCLHIVHSPHSYTVFCDYYLIIFFFPRRSRIEKWLYTSAGCYFTETIEMLN